MAAGFTYPAALRPFAARSVPAAGDGGKRILRLLTCGSVDDGKSTLIGRLLYEIGGLPDDQVAQLRKDSERQGAADGEIDFSLVTDGLEDERAQGITIDVAYRYLTTPRRSFIIADTPGHVRFTRNMATGASNCQAALLLVDARRGLTAQTRRHALICTLMGVRNIVLAVNKIDLIDFDPARYRSIVEDFREVGQALGVTEQAIPVSARFGHNVSTSSTMTPWYTGPTLLELLEDIEPANGTETGPFRFIGQAASRPDSSFRGIMGSVAGGSIAVGETVINLRSREQARINRIVSGDGDLTTARAGREVTLVLDDESDAARGDVFARPEAVPLRADQFAATVIWLGEEALSTSRTYLMRLNAQTAPVSITSIQDKYDLETLEKVPASLLEMNDIATCHFAARTTLVFDPYKENRNTGAFILIDRNTGATVAAGMVTRAIDRSADIHQQALTVTAQARAALMNQKPVVLWFTGLSGAGKSTIADAVEARLHRAGHISYLLDGDNIRRGLNRDLSFTDADRVENIRRIGEVARLFADAGLIVLCAAISPFARERQQVREWVGPDCFVEVFVDTPLATCITRDPKGLYAKAQRGEIKRFTGIDSPYEAPVAPDLHLRTVEQTIDGLVEEVIQFLKSGRFVGDHV